MIDDEIMLSTHEHQNIGHGLWSLCSIGSKGKRINKLFLRKKDKLEKKKQGVRFLFSILNMKCDYLKIIHIHEAQLNMGISVYTHLLRHPWVM